MATEVSKNTTTPSTKEDYFHIPKWDADPLVVISKRIYDLSFPLPVLFSEPTKEDFDRWYKPEAIAADRGDKIIRLHAGVTFLGAFTTSWALRDIVDPNMVPKGAPRPDDCILVFPDCTARDEIDGPQFRDPETQSLLGTEVFKAFKRVLDFIKMRDSHFTKTLPKHSLFTASRTGDSPEIMLLPLSEVFQHGSSLMGQRAYETVLATVKTHRTATHLGALHDYARRNPNGLNIVEACRIRGRKLVPSA